MNSQNAAVFLQCHRAGRSDDSRIRKALKAAEKDPQLQQQFQEQTEFDERVLRAVGAILMPEDLRARLDALQSESDTRRHMHWRSLIRHPAILAVAFAALVMVGVGVFIWREGRRDFEGKDAVSEMIDMTQEMTGMEMEPVATQAGKLEDWLFLKYGLEHFNVPEKFAGLKTVGCRVFRQEGHPVAQIAIEKNRMLFYIFRADDFGVQLKPPEKWNVFQQDDWVAAIRSYADKCFMIAFRGTEPQMNRVLAEMEK